MRSDSDLVSAASAGDQSALAEIYDRYADRIHDFCHSMLRDRHEAADAMQEEQGGTSLRTLGQLNRAVAARVMCSGISATGEVRICLQACVLITSTALTSCSSQVRLNRYVYSVRLCE